MTLIEKLEDRAFAIRDYGDEERLGEALEIENCVRDIEAASNPRAPKPEWFGTGPRQWDSWWVDTGCGVIRRCRMDGDHIIGALENGVPVSLWIGYVRSVIPVRREDPPAMDVGWGVVGEE